VSGNHSINDDFWILKLDSAGNKQWAKCYGGSGQEIGVSITQVSGGGYIACGSSHSDDGDVGFHYGETDPDYWIIRIDTAGNIIWSKVLGGTDWDYPYRIIEYPGGKYIVIGWSASVDGDVTTNLGIDDVWLVMLDANGNVLWNKNYGGFQLDLGVDLIKDFNGNITCLAETESSNGWVSFNYGSKDYWLFQIDTNGTLLWEKSFGGAGIERPKKVIQSPDSGYIIVGYSSQSGGTGLVSNNYGGEDYWIVSADKEHNFISDKNFGGTSGDFCFSAVLSSNALYLTGASQSSNIDVTGHKGDELSSDAWTLELELPTAIWTGPSSIDLTLYPDPASEYVNIKGNGNFFSGNLTITVFNSLGHELKRINTSVENKAPFSLAVSEFPPGIYYISLNNDYGAHGYAGFLVVHS